MNNINSQKNSVKQESDIPFYTRNTNLNQIEDDINTDSWINTYADTITLLLTFFVLLYSTAIIDQKKFQKIADALNGELNVSLEDIEKNFGDTTEEDLIDKINLIIIDNELDEVMNTEKVENGVLLKLEASILFDSGKATLKENSKDILNIVGSMFPKIDNDIMISGHTDNAPIKSEQFASNWQLSTARAVEVLEYFVNEMGLEPSRFSASGFGEYRPIKNNDTEANMKENRRVEILIVEGE